MIIAIKYFLFFWGGGTCPLPPVSYAYSDDSDIVSLKVDG